MSILPSRHNIALMNLRTLTGIELAYPRKMEAIGMRRTLRQVGGVACALRRLAGEREQRWCLIAKEER